MFAGRLLPRDRPRQNQDGELIDGGRDTDEGTAVWRNRRGSGFRLDRNDRHTRKPHVECGQSSGSKSSSLAIGVMDSGLVGNRALRGKRDCRPYRLASKLGDSPFFVEEAGISTAEMDVWIFVRFSFGCDFIMAPRNPLFLRMAAESAGLTIKL